MLAHGLNATSRFLAMTQSIALKSPSWFSDAAPGSNLLVAAAYSWENTPESDRYVQQALAQPTVGLDVLISAYRYYFYKNADELALQVANTVLSRVQQLEGWPTDWETLKPILISRLDDEMARLYLNAYAAVGLLLARLGQVEEARVIGEQVQQIGAKEFGADVLLTVLNSSPDEDDEDEEEDTP